MSETAYTTLVRPQLEYAAPIWDPNTKEKALQLEKIQRRAARWTTSNYDYRSSVTSMLDQLSWRTLEQRGADTRWSMELWQYPSQITSSLHIECPVTVTQWHFVRSIQTGTIISIHSFHWLLSSGMPCQSLLLVCKTLKPSRSLWANCNTQNPRSWHCCF